MYFFPNRYKVCICIKLKNNVNFILIFEQLEFQIVICYYKISIFITPK